MTMPCTHERAATPTGTPRRMSAVGARATTASTAMAAGAATETATARTTTTTCGQQMRGESAGCMPGHLAEGRCGRYAWRGVKHASSSPLCAAV